MKKKLLSILMSTLMITSILAGCSNTTVDSHSTPTDQVEITTEHEKNDKEVKDDDKPPHDEHIDLEPVELTNEAGSVANATDLIDYLNDGSTNTIISETSLNMALSMLYAGANEDSEAYDVLSQYLSVAHPEYNTVDLMSQYHSNLIYNYGINDRVTLNLCNSIWANNDFNFLPDYVNSIQTNYNGEASTLDFTDPASADIMNDWISNHTNNTIRDLISPAAISDSNMVLINTLYFLGDWREPFEDHNCRDAEFTNANGSTSTVNMMYDYDCGAYYDNDQAEAFMKPYEDSNLVFIGILPKSEEFTVSNLNIDSLIAESNANYNYQVNIGLPQFTVNDRNSFYDAFSNNVLAPIMNPRGVDDFNGTMTDCTISISDIIQQTYVDVNPKGTEASAATAVIVNKVTSVMDEPEIREIILNRPFVFMIYDTETHETLFIGRINEL